MIKSFEGLAVTDEQIAQRLNDESVTEEAKDMLRAAVKAGNWRMVNKLLTSDARLPDPDN